MRRPEPYTLYERIPTPMTATGVAGTLPSGAPTKGEPSQRRRTPNSVWCPWEPLAAGATQLPGGICSHCRPTPRGSRARQRPDLLVQLQGRQGGSGGLPGAASGGCALRSTARRAAWRSGSLSARSARRASTTSAGSFFCRHNARPAVRPRAAGPRPRGAPGSAPSAAPCPTGGP